MLLCDPYGRPLCPLCRSMMLRGGMVQDGDRRVLEYVCPDVSCAHSSKFFLAGRNACAKGSPELKAAGNPREGVAPS